MWRKLNGERRRRGVVALLLLLVVVGALAVLFATEIVTSREVTGSDAAVGTPLATLVATTASSASSAAPIMEGDGRERRTGRRFLTMNPLLPWYGITNQLMCYAAALRYGIDDHRDVLFPMDTRNGAVLPFYALIDVNVTQARIGGAVTIALPSVGDRLYGYGTRPPAGDVSSLQDERYVPWTMYPPTSMNKKKLYLPERTQYRSRNVTALRMVRKYLTLKVYPRSRDFPFIRHHNFFMRFAWPSTLVDPAAPFLEWDECRIMAALAPTPSVQRYFEYLHRVVGRGQPFVAIHLRVEPDAALLRPKKARAPSTEQYLRFFRRVVTPLAAQYAAGTVYLCTGSVPAALERAVQQWDSALPRITYRELVTRGNSTDLSPPPLLPVATGSQRQIHRSIAAKTQDHYASFVDLLMLSHAAASVVTHFSSLKFAVFARRCSGVGGRPAAGDAAAVYTVGIGDEGDIATPELGGLQRFACPSSSSSPLGWCGAPEWGEGA